MKTLRYGSETAVWFIGQDRQSPCRVSDPCGLPKCRRSAVTFDGADPLTVYFSIIPKRFEPAV